MNIKKIIIVIFATLFTVTVSASPLLNSWEGSGSARTTRFCQYGDGQVVTVPFTRNCPLSN